MSGTRLGIQRDACSEARQDLCGRPDPLRWTQPDKRHAHDFGNCLRWQAGLHLQPSHERSTLVLEDSLFEVTPHRLWHLYAVIYGQDGLAIVYMVKESTQSLPKQLAGAPILFPACNFLASYVLSTRKSSRYTS
eukprot:4897587-Amphidinium_carterae.1